jgi:hypothetical protein
LSAISSRAFGIEIAARLTSEVDRMGKRKFQGLGAARPIAEYLAMPPQIVLRVENANPDPVLCQRAKESS